MSIFGSHLVSAYLWQNPLDNMLKRLSKNHFIALNVLLFLLPFVYQFLAKTNKLSGEYGHYNVIVYVAAFLFGIIFYMVDYPKTEEDKDLRDGNRFLISNTFINVVFALVFLGFEMELFTKLMSIMFLILGNTYFWLVTYLSLTLVKYSNEVIQKSQRTRSIVYFCIGLIFLVFSVFNIEFKTNFFTPIFVVSNWIILFVVNQFSIRSTPESERYDDPERFNNASRV